MKTSSPLASERGLTLTELTIVMVLAVLVMAGLVGFYLSSQATWVDGSAQAITQREATSLVDDMSDSVHVAASASVFDSPDSLHQGVVLYDKDGIEFYRFFWKPADSLVHEGSSVSDDRGPSARSAVTRFQLAAGPRLVNLRALEMESSQGARVRLSSSMAMYNRVIP